jgi:hypothetical protein
MGIIGLKPDKYKKSDYKHIIFHFYLVKAANMITFFLPVVCQPSQSFAISVYQSILHDNPCQHYVFKHYLIFECITVATSTLAMGVNLPAHLVILKSTQYYNMGIS